jgi:hypothetical protein
MLKPGGYIQWDDLNYPDTHIIKANADADTPAFYRLPVSWNAMALQMPGWIISGIAWSWPWRMGTNI